MYRAFIDRRDVDAYAIEELGAWLRDWRILTGHSQRLLAAWAGIHQSGISRMERGLTRVSSDRLARLVVVLDWLSGGGDPRGPWEATYLPPGATRRRPRGAGPPRVIRSIVTPQADAWGVIGEGLARHDDAWGVIGDEDGEPAPDVGELTPGSSG